MIREEIENHLTRLGTHWPAPSQVEAVMARITSEMPRPRRAAPLWHRRRLLVAGGAVLALALVAPVILLLTAPRTLEAQVQQALEKAHRARIVISIPSENGPREKVEIWYSRDHGIRAESPDEIIVDNGHDQWTWGPKLPADEMIVARRASRDGIVMIGEMLHLRNAPADWERTPTPELDREIGGRRCQAFIVEPPKQVAVSESGEVVPDPHPSRIIVLVDPSRRVVRLEHQARFDKEWRPGREISIDYDVEIAPEKFVANFPVGARVIDADRALDERFPLEKALATTEAGGLLFAVHDVALGPDDMVYVVSSVRGTPEHLEKFPPIVRRVNLQTTMLDVAEQIRSAHTDLELHRATLASTELDGVHYVWWFAVRRHFFELDQGQRKPHSVSPSFQTRPGRVRVPLMAIYRDKRAGTEWVQASAEVALPADAKPRPLAELAARVRRDALLISRGGGPAVFLNRWEDSGAMRATEPARMTDAEVAESLAKQLEWLAGNDEIRLDAKMP